MAGVMSVWPVRAIVAVIAGLAIGQVAQLPLGLLVDVIWQHEVTGGRWQFSLPNIIWVCITAVIVGFCTGWIAGRRGKLLAAVAAFLPLVLLIAMQMIRNVDMTDYLAQQYDTKPALWTWIGLIPAIFGGHFGALDGKRYFNRAAFFSGTGLLYVGYLGFSLFHLYTAFVAFELAGFIAAVISLAIVGVSELYWVVQLWEKSGTFLTQYTAIPLSLIASMILGVTLIGDAEKTKNTSNQT